MEINWYGTFITTIQSVHTPLYLTWFFIRTHTRLHEYIFDCCTVDIVDCNPSLSVFYSILFNFIRFKCTGIGYTYSHCKHTSTGVYKGWIKRTCTLYLMHTTSYNVDAHTHIGLKWNNNGKTTTSSNKNNINNKRAIVYNTNERTFVVQVQFQRNKFSSDTGWVVFWWIFYKWIRTSILVSFDSHTLTITSESNIFGILITMSFLLSPREIFEIEKERI